MRLLNVTRRYRFCAAHWLPKVPEGHKCKNLHGHNYRADVTLEGTLDESGFVMDFWDMDELISPIIKRVDHNGALNDIEGLENPTAEIIAYWFAMKVTESLNARYGTGLRIPRLVRVTIYEEEDCCASFEF